jgi:ATP synthase protein I
VCRNLRPAAAGNGGTGIRAGNRARGGEAGGLRHASARSHTTVEVQTRHNGRAAATRTPRFRPDAAVRCGHTRTAEEDARGLMPMPPQKSTADTMRTIGALSTVGISIVLAIMIGAACGYYLDRWLGTGPWLFLLFVLFGIAAGITNVYRTAGRFLK